MCRSKTYFLFTVQQETNSDRMSIKSSDLDKSRSRSSSEAMKRAKTAAVKGKSEEKITGKQNV